MMKKALVVFALKEEFAPWKRRHGFRTVPNSLHPVSLASMGSADVYAALVGAGARGLKRISDLTTEIQPSIAIITGVAAGLKPDWRSGDILAAESATSPDQKISFRSDPNLLRLAVECGAKIAPKLLTLPRIVRTVDEKRQLGEMSDAADMESLPLMELWAARGIPAIALRVVLDALDAPMTFDFESAFDAEGQVQAAKVIGQVLRNPKLLPNLIHLARQNRRALRALAEFLDQFVGEWNRITGIES
jgi:nucleoside phosphorylase